MIVLGLSLLTFIAPEVVVIIGGILIVSTWALDVIQLYRYDAQPDKGIKLGVDIVKSLISIISPFGDIVQSIIDALDFSYNYRNGAG